MTEATFAFMTPTDVEDFAGLMARLASGIEVMISVSTMTIKRGKESFSGYNKPKRTPNHPKNHTPSSQNTATK